VAAAQRRQGSNPERQEQGVRQAAVVGNAGIGGVQLGEELQRAGQAWVDGGREQEGQEGMHGIRVAPVRPCPCHALPPTQGPRRVTAITSPIKAACYAGAVAQRDDGRSGQGAGMADDRDARIAQVEAENAALREREALLVGQGEQRDRALAQAL
jgi:hypothetical protein